MMTSDDIRDLKQRQINRPKITMPAALKEKVVEYQTRMCMASHTEAILSLVRKGLKVEGLL